MVSHHRLGGLILEGLDSPLTGSAVERKRLALLALHALLVGVAYVYARAGRDI
jgi:hypothetical protein